MHYVYLKSLFYMFDCTLINVIFFPQRILNWYIRTLFRCKNWKHNCNFPLPNEYIVYSQSVTFLDVSLKLQPYILDLFKFSFRYNHNSNRYHARFYEIKGNVFIYYIILLWCKVMKFFWAQSKISVKELAPT